MEQKKEMRNHLIKIGVLVVAIITLGISLTYAYYSIQKSGEADIDNINAAKFIIKSTLEDSKAISNSQMTLINAEDISIAADKVEFSVTNDAASTVSGQYYVHLTDISITKNLYSEYFKWQLVRKTDTTESIIDSGDFGEAIRTSIAVEGEEETILTTAEDIPLNKVALEIPVNTTDNLIFRMWLENDVAINQVALANGAFQGKLKIEAYPKK